MSPVQSIARFTGAVLLAVLAACDPLFTTRYRQALAPAPAQGCVEVTLRASPLVAVVWRDTTRRARAVSGSYVVTMRDSLTPGGRWSARVEHGGAGDSAWVWVSYSYPGFATPPAADRARWGAEAGQLLDSIRVRCAPLTPRGVQCRSVGGLGGQRGACVAAP